MRTLVLFILSCLGILGILIFTAIASMGHEFAFVALIAVTICTGWAMEQWLA